MKAALTVEAKRRTFRNLKNLGLILVFASLTMTLANNISLEENITSLRIPPENSHNIAVISMDFRSGIKKEETTE